ncbi:hypothetical protein [Mycolicibacterium litorale]|uniref:Transmembrane protein n=1 Tax=Mycolicibacterium litorale TaxID=758802 RepID=A0AAD1IMK4_9MYCO|nr:hypothetical protein [Mycolicibacterium litorale]MCV7416687.1 hypothetical protein [Mycolicibacterium litorale]TDY09939.1 hypothetical protein BCL50_2045 [Mycolicibacterium litorale]BBY17899.1 hypothetical protein MLIT_34910 [Mycolicibacterium litorale]
MTEPENSSSSTRPISVAELLAKNGTIGAPPVGGRRRRRRGNADAVTVAELTGEIPIITDRPRDTTTDETGRIPVNGAAQPTLTEPAPEVTPAPDELDATETTDVTETVEPVVPEAPAPEPADAEPETDEVEVEVVEIEVVENEPATTRERDAVGADAMSPDPLIDDDDESADLLDPAMELDEPALLERSDDDDDELPSYLRSSAGPLFGGGTVADDLARKRGDTDTIDDELDDVDDADLIEADLAEDDLDEQDLRDEAPADRMSAFLRGAWIVGQCIIAVAFGAGLFIAFDQLWKWNNIVALVLSVLVILGLVVGVRVVRKTEDIGSTLIAVAVGALVTLGPLALLQSG